MSLIETAPMVKHRVGIEKITYSPGDYREKAGYNVVFFRDDKKYYEYLQVESAEILMDILGIDKEEVMQQ